jgi:hypothetical protein
LYEEPSAPQDFYGQALECAVRRGEEHPELVAALMAQITEALVDVVSPPILHPPC